MNDQAVLDPTLVAAKAEDTLWYKDAIIYELHVKAFFDSNDDGIGDFKGLTDKLDYIQDLGVTAIWLLPFYPSPMRDDGYDVADYHNVYAPYGTRNDVRQLERATIDKFDLRLAESDTPIELLDGYIGPGYAIPTPSGLEALRTIARLEGLLLDPSYTSKAFAGMLDLMRNGGIRDGAVPMFLHTGGVFGLMAARAVLDG